MARSNPEALLISSVLRTGDHVTAPGRGLSKKFFHSYGDEWAWIDTYIQTHKRAPSKNAFAAKFPDFRIKAVDDVAHFCEEVRRSHLEHELSLSIQDIIGRIEVGDIDNAVRTMHSSALDIESQMSGMGGDADIFEHWEPIYDEALHRMARQNDFGMAGIPTGFPTLDERTGGPQPGQVWIVAARLGQGKTWSLIRMATAAAFSGYVVQYDALEQTRAEIAMRVHSFASSEYGKQTFKSLDLSQGRNFSPRDYKEFLQELKKQIGGKFHIADSAGGSLGLSAIAAQIERNRPDAVFLDYITLMDTPSGESDWRGVAGLSKGMKQIAGRYKVPIIAAAQLNRSAASGKELSGPENLAESDALGRDADAVITMRQLSKRVIAMKLAKFRHGPDGYTIYTVFKPNTGHFEEVTKDEALDIQGEDRDDEESEEFSFKPREKGSFAKTNAARNGEPKKRIVVPRPKGHIPPTKRKIIVKGK